MGIVLFLIGTVIVSITIGSLSGAPYGFLYLGIMLSALGFVCGLVKICKK